MIGRYPEPREVVVTRWSMVLMCQIPTATSTMKRSASSGMPASGMRSKQFVMLIPQRREVVAMELVVAAMVLVEVAEVAEDAVVAVEVAVAVISLLKLHPCGLSWMSRVQL